MNARFVAMDSDFDRMPGLAEFLEKVDKDVSDFAEESGADETELRRLVVGSVGYKDLTQLLDNFKSSESVSRGRATSAWNAFVAYHAETDEDFAFTPEYMQILTDRYKLVDEQLQKKVEYKKKMLEENKKNKKRKNPPSRVELFDSCVKDLKMSIEAMHKNFQHHIIMYGINGVRRHEDDFGTFAITNSRNCQSINIQLKVINIFFLKSCDPGCKSGT